MCVDCQGNCWLILAQSGFEELRQDEAKQVWLIPMPKPEHLPCPLQAAAAPHPPASTRRAFPGVRVLRLISSLSRRARGTSRSELLGRKLAMPFFVLHFTSFVFRLAAKPEAKRWLKRLSPGRGSRAHRTPSSGLASHCRREGNAAAQGGRAGAGEGGGLLQLRPWAA